MHSNLISTSHALDYCRKHKTKMIFFSTYLYSKTARQPTIEEEKIDPANPYALSKLMGEQLCTFMQIILIFLISELVFLIQLAI